MRYINTVILIYDMEEYDKAESMGLDSEAFPIEAMIFIDHITMIAPGAEPHQTNIWTAGFEGSTLALEPMDSIIDKIAHPKEL